MAWGKAGRPEWKECHGHGRKPHRCRYDTDFPRIRRKLKDGTIADYAGSLCYSCRRKYERELRRMNNRLAGKATRPNDTPWKRNRKEIPANPFMRWLRAYMRKNDVDLETLCAQVGLANTRAVRRWRQYGHIGQPETAVKFLQHAGQAHLAEELLYQYIRLDGERRTPRVDSAPFFRWFAKYLMSTGNEMERMCRAAGVSSNTLRRCRRTGRMELGTAEKIFAVAGLPQMSHVLYPELSERRAA